MKKSLTFFLITLLFIRSLSSQVVEKNIFENWIFKNSKDTIWYNAKVPGCVHTDLLYNKLIPQPFYGINEKQLQYIELNDYEYSCKFDLQSNIFDKQNITLVFEGLDTYADVFLNNKLILKADNMFRTWEINCKELLKLKNNELKIKFSSSVNNDKKKESESTVKLPDSRAYTRKAPYQYGWDWGPRFVTSGIWRPVKIIAWNNIKINSVYFVQKEISLEKAQIESEIEVESNIIDNVTITVYNSKTNQIAGIQNINLVKGINNVNIPFTIKNPDLWFPNGMGNANLYLFKTTISRNKQLIDSANTTIGLRKIELINEKDSIGESFYFKINGVPLFMKGANYIPTNSFTTETSNKTYEKLLQDVVNANMNMLRIWGGGIYENDEFYKLCDKNGILIWQDFMFACTMYPGDIMFAESVRNEAIDNIKRLRNHACLAIWCGNNEIDEGWHNWGWQKQLVYSPEDSAKIWEDYQKIFHEVLPKAVAKYDNVRSYISTSPRKGWGRKESMTEGDSHYWGVWWGNEPFEMYIKKTGRFMSEYGFQGMPDLKTIKSTVDDTCLNFNSLQLRNHQKHSSGFETIDEYLKRDYKSPKDFASYIHVSQLLQAEGMKIAIESHRRAKPKCMGTLYWQLNDCWPVTSWSSIDFYGRWKALHYFVKKLYQNVIISQTITNDKIEVWVVSDLSKKIDTKIQLKLLDFNGNPIWEKQIPIQIAANSSKIVFEIKKEDLLKNNDKTKILLYAELFENNTVIASNILYFTGIKNLELQEPHIAIKINTISKSISEIILKSNILSKNVFINSPLNITLSDNFFDLLPGETKIIRINHENIKPQLLLKDIKITTLYNTY